MVSSRMTGPVFKWFLPEWQDLIRVWKEILSKMISQNDTINSQISGMGINKRKKKGNGFKVI